MAIERTQSLGAAVPLAERPAFIPVLAVLLLGFALYLPISLWIDLSPETFALPSGKRLWSVRSESSAWTWANVCVLALGAAVYLCRAVARRREGARFWFSWLAMAGILAALSFDDAVSLHERLRRFGKSLGGGDGYLYFEWVIPGAAIALLIVLAFAAHLRGTRRSVGLLTVLGLLFLFGGAIGVEMIGAAEIDGRGKTAWFYILSHIEEYLEAAGAIFLLAAGLADLDGPMGRTGWAFERRTAHGTAR